MKHIFAILLTIVLFGCSQSHPQNQRSNINGTTTGSPSGSSLFDSKTAKPGELLELTVKDTKLRFRWCPAGTFMMGDESFAHKVTLTQGFWMAETEMTQEQHQGINGGNPSYYFKGAKLPVELVSWDDCQEFVAALNKLAPAGLPAGYKFALPTEAQWEYACRAGTTGDYAGNLDDMAWYSNNSEGKTYEVGTKKPNAWNLYDMHGNMWEWCNDWYGDYPSGAVTDPTGANTGSYRVLRGGAWDSGAEFCRSAKRFSTPADQDIDVGFRLALVSGE